MKRTQKAAYFFSTLSLLVGGGALFAVHPILPTALASTHITALSSIHTYSAHSMTRLQPKASAGHHAQPIKEPPIPQLTPLSVTSSTLDQNTITTDVRQLANLFQQHPGDGITRGPDELIYNLDVTINPKLHEFAGHMQVHFHNNLKTSISTLYLNVWPDAPHYRRAGGYEKIESAAVNGEPQTFTLNGTVLAIPLKQHIAQDGTGILTLNFLAKLPKIDDRYGYEGTTMNFGNWFPLLAVHDEYGFVTPPYYNDGESFYSLTGDFHLHVTAPKALVLAISGEAASTQANGGGNVIYNYNALGVRDVAMVGDTQFKVLQGTIGGTTVYTYYTPEEANMAETMENVGTKSITYYNQHYGLYPYPTLRVCAMHGWFGGMEYPQLVMISFDQGDNGADVITADVTHEVAHQWFFSMVGDDQYLTPWLDEAFATLSENRFDNGFDQISAWQTTPEHVTYPVSAFPSSDFSSVDAADHYYYAVYYRGANALYALMNMMGQNRFDTMMQGYFNRYQYQVATTDDFIRYANQAAGTDLTNFFKQHGIIAKDDLSAPTNFWAKLEMSENKHNWHS